MKRHSESFIHAEDAGGSRMGRFWHGVKVVFTTLVPYIENITCFFLFFFLNNLAAGSGYVARLDFFLLYVLLFAVIHGQKQAVLSGLLAVGGYCLQQMYSRTGFEVLLDYNTYVWMAQLFIVGLVVGYIKDQLRTVKQEDRDEIAYLEGKLSDIMDINDSNVRMKENFETQLVNQRDSLGKIYEITSGLESQAPEEVLFSAARILSELMDCGDVAVYTVANQNYARLFSSTSLESRSLGGSIKYTDMDEMYRELKERRVYINRNMADKLPLMASAVYNDGEIALIFMLWGIPRPTGWRSSASWCSLRWYGPINTWRPCTARDMWAVAACWQKRRFCSWQRLSSGRRIRGLQSVRFWRCLCLAETVWAPLRFWMAISGRQTIWAR